VKISDKQATDLQEWLTENYGEMDVVVGVGANHLFCYVQRGKKHMSVIPSEWEGVPVVSSWTGKIKPL